MYLSSLSSATKGGTQEAENRTSQNDRERKVGDSSEIKYATQTKRMKTQLKVKKNYFPSLKRDREAGEREIEELKETLGGTKRERSREINEKLL